MPNRIIKESITTSATLAKLSGDEERHFWRLIVQADDYGYLDARPEVIRAKGYAMMLDQVSAAASEAHTQALARADLLHLFEAEGKRYGHFPTWERHQQVRAKRRRYPQVQSCEGVCNHMLAGDSKRNQMIAYAPVIQSESLSESLSESESNPCGSDVASQLPSPPLETQEGDKTVWPDYYATLWAIPGFKVPLPQCEAWREKQGISLDHAETTAYAVKSKWPGPKTKPYTDAWATFQVWAKRPPLSQNGTNRAARPLVHYTQEDYSADKPW